MGGVVHAFDTGVIDYRSAVGGLALWELFASRAAILFREKTQMALLAWMGTLCLAPSTGEAQ